MATETEVFNMRMSKELKKRIEREARRQKIDAAVLVRRVLNHFLDDVDAQLDQEKGTEDVQSFSEHEA